ncbi:unnamed protein product [Ostreobium quekettii]|uniref:K Homology domain-containing protein n=1 Tax=Ostreobium quekettii TaxID=121088 RepID=A0A8S1ILN6_9CHLO|nr:unnamed protein product [Ostreobium quekettii]
MATNGRLRDLLSRFTSKSEGWAAVAPSPAGTDFADFAQIFSEFASAKDPSLASDYRDPASLREALAAALPGWNAARGPPDGPDGQLAVELKGRNISNVQILRGHRESGARSRDARPREHGWRNGEDRDRLRGHRSERDAHRSRPREDGHEGWGRERWAERGRREEGGWRKRRGEGERAERGQRRRTGESGEYDFPRHRYDDYEKDIHDAPTDPEEVCIKAEMPVRRDLAGAVIGHRGETVSRIRRISGAHVHLCEPQHGESERVVELIGTRVQVEAACKEVRAVMMEEAGEWTMEHGYISRATIQLHIAPEMVGCLIGKGGGNVKNIKSSTGASVRVDHLVEGDTTQTVHICGDPDAVLRAHTMVMATLRGFDQRKSRLGRTPVGPPQLSEQQHHQAEPGEILPTPTPMTNARSAAAAAAVAAALNSSATAALNGSATAALNGSATAAPALNGAGVPQPMVNMAPLGGLPADGTQVVQQMPANAGLSVGAQFVLQTPQGGATPPPTVLVLQPDGTYLPAPVVLQTMAGMQQPSSLQAAGLAPANVQQATLPNTSMGLAQIQTNTIESAMVTTSQPMQSSQFEQGFNGQLAGNLQQPTIQPQLTNSIQAASVQTSVVGDAVSMPLQVAVTTEGLMLPMQAGGLAPGMYSGLNGDGSTSMVVIGEDGNPQALPSGYAALASLSGMQAIQMAPGAVNMALSMNTETPQQVQNVPNDKAAV